MTNKMKVFAIELRERYEQACAEADMTDREYDELNFQVDSLPEWQYTMESDHWDAVLDKAYDRMVNARKLVYSYERALNHASKLYSALQDIEEYEEEMRG